MDNWLAKLASEQPTNEENLKQVLGDLSLPDLQELAEQPITPHLDNLEEKVAEADQMGRDLAKSHGPGLAAQAEQRAVQNHAVMKSVADLSDDEAIKMAYVLEHGSDMEKEAFVASLAGKALKMGKGLLSKASPAIGKAKGMGAKALSSGPGQKALAWGAKNPTAAGAVAGGAVGGVHSKATGGSFLGGAALGAGMGAGGAAMAGKGNVGRFLGKTHSRFNKMASSPLTSAVQAMVSHDLSKLAYMDDNKNEWLEQFEGTPLLEQAVGMVKDELQTEIDSIESRKVEDEHRREQDQGPSSYHEKDMLRAKKKMLELQLVAQRNGMGDPTGAGVDAGGEQPPEGGEMAPPPPEEGGEMPPAEAPQPEAAPMEAAQEQVKMAYAQALSKTAGGEAAMAAANLAIPAAIQGGGYAIGKKRGGRHYEEGTGRKSKHPILKSLFVPGGLGHEIGRRKGYDQAAAASKEKKAGYGLARLSKSVRTASNKAAKAAKGAAKQKPRMVDGLSTMPLSKLGGRKTKALIGAGALALGAAGGGAIGHKKGKKKGLKKGRRQGFGVGVRRGYQAGAQRGYAVGRSHSAAAKKTKTASFS